MKKYLLSLLLVTGLLFSVFIKAHAAGASTITFTSVASPTGNPVQFGQTGVVLYELKAKANNYTIGSSTVTGLTLNSANTGQTISNYFSTANIQLYYSQTAGLTGMQVELAANGFMTSTVNSTGTTLTFSGFSQSVGANNTGYFYVLCNYDVAAGASPTNFELDGTASAAAIMSSATTNTYTTAGLAGTQYTLQNGAVTISSLTTTANMDGLSNTPVPAGATNYAVAGFSIVGTGTVTTNISALTFYIYGNSADPTASYFTTAYLYSSSTPNYQPGVTNVPANLVGQVNSNTNNNQQITIPTTLSVAAGTTTYYFIVLSNNLGDTNTNSFNLGYFSETYTGTALSLPSGYNTGVGASNPVVGPNYTFLAPSIVITSLTTTTNTDGLSATPVPSGSTNYAVAGFSMVSTGATSNITALQFYLADTYSDYLNAYYQTAYLYSSTSSTYVPGTTNVMANLVGTATAGANRYINFATNLTIAANTTTYYFIVLSNTYGDVNPNPFLLQYNAETSTGTSLTLGSGYVGPQYTFSANPTITTTDITTGLSPAPPANIFQGTVATVAGIGLSTSSASTNVTQLVFSYTGTANIGTYFNGANPILYSSANDTYAAGGLTVVPNVTVAITGTTGGNITFTITAPSAYSTASTTPIYFYCVGTTNATGGTPPQTFTFLPVSYTTPLSSGAVATGYTISNSYTIVPALYVTAANSAGFAGSTIGASITTPTPIFGFAVSSKASNTINTFNFGYTLTPTTGSLTAIFPTITLYSSTINDFSTAMPVTDPGSGVTAVTANSFSYSSLSQSINNGTVYYFLVITYTATATTYTFTPKLVSMIVNPATTYSAATIGFPVTGTTYTLTKVGPLTYYWTGNQQGTNPDWRNPANWETTMTANGGGTNAGAYPGTNPTDNAIFNYYTYQGTTGTPTISGYDISMGTLSVYGSNFIAAPTFYSTPATITVNSADSLTVATLNIGLSTGNGTKQNTLTIVGTGSGVKSSLRVTGTATIYNYSQLTASTNSILNFPSGSAFNFTGTTNTQGLLLISGGKVNTSGCNFQFCPVASPTFYGGVIGMTSGALSVNGATLNVNGITPQIYSNGGTSQFNNCTINFTGSYAAGTISGYLINAGTVTFSGTSASPSTINLGTSATNGVGEYIANDGGIFNLGAYSTININSVNTHVAAQPYHIENFGGGVFTCASTSVINPTSSNANIYNSSAANTFTLLSDGNGSATIGTLGASGSISGLYNVQRYITTASHGYRMLASPVNENGLSNPSATSNTTTPNTSINMVDMSALGRDVSNVITGNTYYYGAFVGGYLGATGGFTNTTPGPTLYINQESIIPDPATEDQSYTGGKNVAVINIKNSNASGSYTVSTANTAAAGLAAADNATNVQVPVGNGYFLYYIHSDSVTAVVGNLNTSASTATGYMNQGTIPVYLFNKQTSSFSNELTKNGSAAPSALSGYNLVGNPYPASIDLQQLLKDNIGTVFSNNTTATFTELAPANEQFYQYNYSYNTVTNTGTATSSGASPLLYQYIGSGQAFYAVITNANKTLLFKEDQKVTSATGPSVVLESYPVAGAPAATVDSVAVNNKTTDAVVAGNLKTTADEVSLHAAGLHTAGLKNNDAVVLNDSTGKKLHLAVAQAIAKDLPNDTVSSRNNNPPVVTSPVTPPTIAAIAGLHLKLVQDSINYDECGVYFDKKWSDNFDVNDARDLDGNAGKVFLSSYSADDVRTGINALGDYKGGKRVKLYAGFSASGLYQLQMEDIFNFNTNKYSVFLIDNLLKDSLDLTLYKSYNFNYTSGTANDSTRFVLAIEHKPVPHYALLAFAGAKVTEGVKLNWTTLNEANYTTFVLQKLNAGNTYAFLDSLQSDSAGAYSYVDQHPVLGSNTYRLQQTDGLGNITYSSPVTIGYNSTTPNGGLTIYPNPSKAMITVTLATGSTATAVATADIYNSSGVLVEHKVVNSNSFTHDISAYNLGVYVIRLKNSNGIIVGDAKFVKVQ